MASGPQWSQSACQGELAAVDPAAGTLDSIPPSSASLSSSALCREASKVGAVCVNAPVRICAGGDQQWSSLPRHYPEGALISGLGPGMMGWWRLPPTAFEHDYFPTFTSAEWVLISEPLYRLAC